MLYYLEILLCKKVISIQIITGCYFEAPNLSGLESTTIPLSRNCLLFTTIVISSNVH